MSTKLAMIQEFYDRVWVGGAVEEAPRFFDISAKTEGLMQDLAVDPLEFAEFVAAILQMLDVTRVTLEPAVEQGDWISVITSFEASVHATGQTITGTGMLMVRIVDGKIVTAYNCIDFLTLFEKLGLVPENAAALCMTGQQLS